jgi:hypothetical protein
LKRALRPRAEKWREVNQFQVKLRNHPTALYFFYLQGISAIAILSIAGREIAAVIRLD